jgi:peptidoglycan/xylan/chitin deacetylase (PgdA/CDA1 family)
MKVSLTFDNGPDIDITPHVLDTLARFDVPASFFTLGKNLSVPAQRQLTVQAFAAGHRIGNHSYNHAVPFGLVEHPNEAVDEILATDELLGELVGTERMFRPFGRGVIGPHLLNQPVWDLLVQRQYTCVLWNVLVREITMIDTWMYAAMRLCEQQEWSVVVLHDIPTGAMRRLAEFLQMLKDRGATFSQDFPDACTPLRKGVAVGPHDHLIAAPDSSR